MSDDRRRLVLDKLSHSTVPITGSDLADMMDVSRQVIVQDIAILRAQGVPIIATSSGYILQTQTHANRLIKTFVSKHSGFDRMEEELEIIVEYGGKIIDVIVEHPVYGEIVGALHIATKEDVRNFIHKVKETNAKPLASLTEGDHIHTIEIPSEKIFKLILQELRDKGFID
jgi:hypothetical protein